jgi:hypothetical protein
MERGSSVDPDCPFKDRLGCRLLSLRSVRSHITDCLKMRLRSCVVLIATVAAVAIIVLINH